MKKQKGISVFPNRILDLRKERGWSQPELGKKIGTSGLLIGRYERGEVTPSIEVARKLARAFGVTVDYLINEQDIPDILKDREMLDRWQNLEELSQEDKERILSVVDSFLRDAKTRKAYSAN